MRTARLSTSGGLEANSCACAVRKLPAKAPISAVTKPAPPEQSKPRLEIDEPLQLQLHVPNSMAESPRLGKCIVWLSRAIWNRTFAHTSLRCWPRSGSGHERQHPRARRSAFEADRDGKRAF